MKKISILGASGSIGRNTINVIKNNKDEFDLVAFSVYNKINVISEILDEFASVKLVCVKSLLEVKNIIAKYPKVEFVEHEEGLLEVAKIKCDVVVNALVGFVGLKPTIAAIESKHNVALANKETLVVAGELINKLAIENNVSIIPIDSEHSAILQCLEKENKIKSIILTASGGPFFKKSLDELKDVTIEEALAHPTWAMGPKISIDSATMFNKAFEIIEAYHLFKVEKNQIKVLIHPQSVLHSMVEYEDGSIKAQLAISDMKIPIAYALTFPRRLNNVCDSLDLTTFASLKFYKVDLERFIPLKLAYKALEEKGTYACVMNAANEEAVTLFLNHKITFLQIYDIVIKTLNAHNNDKKNISLNDILEADKWAREFVRRNF